MPAVSQDQFANLAYITVTESAANTLTFKKLETGISIFEKVAWVVHRLEYYCDNIAATIFNTTGDYLQLALCSTDQMTSIDLSNAAVIDMCRITRIDLGTAASGFYREDPLIRSFADMPGGGLIVPATRLYLGAVGTGLGGATTNKLRMFYTTKTLKPE